MQVPEIRRLHDADMNVMVVHARQHPFEYC
jgi:hypothetical protein